MFAKARDGDGVDALRDQVGFSGDVVTAGCQRQNHEPDGSQLSRVSLLKNFTHYLHGVLDRDAEVVRDHPKPEGARLIPIRRDGAYRDSCLACHAYVGGRLLVFSRGRRCRWRSRPRRSRPTPGFSSNSTQPRCCSRETPGAWITAAKAWARFSRLPAGWPGDDRFSAPCPPACVANPIRTRAAC